MPTFTRVFTVAAAASILATAATAATEQSFLKKALEGDNSEMTLGRMAQDNGATAGVRDYGKMLSEDHAAAKKKALPVAQSHGVPDTDELAPEAKKERAKLQKLHGRAFDREFAKYMVKDHKHDISDFEKAARSSDPETQKFAEGGLPDLRKHLKVAQSLVDAH